MLTVSIVIMTHNRKEVLEKTIKGILKQDFRGNYEIIVVNDGSTDGTYEMLEKFSKNKKIFIINQPRSFPCKARNNGIKISKNEIIVIMDDDCIPEKDWLSKMIKGFDKKNVGVVSAYDFYGGTSTAFRKKVLDKIGYYDEEYVYYREDTDLVLRFIEAGYKVKKVNARFLHEHEIEKPNGLVGLVKYGLQRASYHKNDVLLYKKHPQSSKNFLGVKFGFLVDPKKDFAAATNNWAGPKKMSLSSPRGIIFLENKSPLHGLLIVFGGICWVLLVKWHRLLASIKFGKLLI